MLSCVEHEKSFITSGADLYVSCFDYCWVKCPIHGLNSMNVNEPHQNPG